MRLGSQSLQDTIANIEAIVVTDTHLSSLSLMILTQSFWIVRCFLSVRMHSDQGDGCRFKNNSTKPEMLGGNPEITGNCLRSLGVWGLDPGTNDLRSLEPRNLNN